MSLDKEIVALFGADTVREAAAIPATLTAHQAETIRDMAKALRSAQQVSRQRQMIDRMKKHEKVLLCRWLSDRNFYRKFVNR